MERRCCQRQVSRGCSHTSPAPGDAPVHLCLLLRAPWLLQDEKEERRVQRGAGDSGVRSRLVRVPCRAMPQDTIPFPSILVWPGESRSSGMTLLRGRSRCCGRYPSAAAILPGSPARPGAEPSGPKQSVSEGPCVPAGQRFPS